MDEVPGEGDTDVSKDDGEGSTLRIGTDAADGYDTWNLVDMTETDRDNDPDESKDSSRVVANKIGGNRRSRNAFPILLGHVGPSDVITISDGRQGADSGSAGHKGNGLNNNKMEGLARLEVTFENLRSHMKPLGTTRGSA